MTFSHASTTDPVSLPEPFTLTSFVCLLCPSFFLPLFFFPQALNEWDVVSLPEPFTLTVHEGRVAPSSVQRAAAPLCGRMWPAFYQLLSALLARPYLLPVTSAAPHQLRRLAQDGCLNTQRPDLT